MFTRDKYKVHSQLYDVPPQFIGGDSRFGMFLAKKIVYPAAARQANVTGRVILTFCVETDGSLSEIKVVRGIGSGCDEAAVKALKASPLWAPAVLNGQPVKAQCSVPIAFGSRDNLYN